jgi:hypothetical protein
MIFSALAGAAGLGGAAAGAAGAGTAAASIGGIGTAISAAGTVAGIAGQLMSASAAKKAEKLRETQMNLESAREKREIVRRSIMARSQALATGTAQGAQYGSGVAGAMGNVTNQAASGLLGVNQNQQIGAGIFSANRQMATAGMIGSFGSGLQSLGGSLVSNQDMYGRLGTYYSAQG